MFYVRYQWTKDHQPQFEAKANKKTAVECATEYAKKNYYSVEILSVFAKLETSVKVVYTRNAE
mgnify:FL=1